MSPQVRSAIAPRLQPACSSQHHTITLKIDSQVLFGRPTPAKAAEEWINLMKAAMAAAGERRAPRAGHRGTGPRIRLIHRYISDHV